MEWLYHVDIGLAAHKDATDVANTAKMAYDIVKAHQPIREGDTMVLLVVRPLQ